MSAGVPGPVARIAILSLTPFYLVLLAAILSLNSRLGMVAATVVVFMSTFAICTIITLFCSRMAQFDDSKNSRFSIEMLMMITAVLAIYLAFIKQVFEWQDNATAHFPNLLGMVVTGALFIGITTSILIWFTNSLIELIKTVARFFYADSDS